MKENEMEFNRLIIAYKRQKNLKELLSPSKLFLPRSLDLKKLRLTPIEHYLKPSANHIEAYKDPDIHTTTHP